MSEYLILRFEAPLQAWGGVAMDPRRPTRSFPSLSAVSGLLASALGWRYRDGDRTTSLQDALTIAVREDRPATRIMDFQTVDLGSLPNKGWTRWGREKRGGAFSKGTHILHKEYLADASYAVAVGLGEGAPVSLDGLEEALHRPARPLFLGRKSCPPAGRILEARLPATTPLEALRRHPASGISGDGRLRFWYTKGSGPELGVEHEAEVWDRRNFLTDRFEGPRTVVEGRFGLQDPKE